MRRNSQPQKRKLTYDCLVFVLDLFPAFDVRGVVDDFGGGSGPLEGVEKTLWMMELLHLTILRKRALDNLQRDVNN